MGHPVDNRRDESMYHVHARLLLCIYHLKNARHLLDEGHLLMSQISRVNDFGINFPRQFLAISQFSIKCMTFSMTEIAQQ